MYKLFKEEGKLKEMPEELDLAFLSEYDKLKERREHLSSLKVYDIEKDDWKDYLNHGVFREDQFVLEETNSHALKFEPFDKPQFLARPAKPSLKDKIENEQPFQKHKELAEIIEWFANNVKVPGTQWNKLLSEINNALQSSKMK